MKKLYFLLHASLILLFSLSRVNAQVSISIRILPPYPTRITDYESKPQQVLITLVNQSTATQNVQLRASVVGDNGIRLEVGQNYKSPSAITLTPGQVRNLNGADLVTLFDYNQLTYTGITKGEFIRGNGLPEGSYQVCMRAYDYNTNLPISGEEPTGCSNRFTISSIEPPLIIHPADGDELNNVNGKVFTINWTTPPGAPPSVKYKIRMIEVIGNRNPNDAVMTALPPYFFEKEVMGNVYVYNPADPQLTPGRRYALVISALDPNNSYTFRNNGNSQVVAFSFVGDLVKNGQGKKPADTASKPKKPLTTNSIKGRALWAFKASEESYKSGSMLGSIGAANVTIPSFNATLSNNSAYNSNLTPVLGNTAVQTGNKTVAGGSNNGVAMGGLVYGAANPLTDNKNNLLNAMATDGTLFARVVTDNKGNTMSAVQKVAEEKTASSFIFASGYQKYDYSIDATSAISANNKIPLVNAVVKIIGIPVETVRILNPHQTEVQKEKNEKQEQSNSQFGIVPKPQNNKPGNNLNQSKENNAKVNNAAAKSGKNNTAPAKASGASPIIAYPKEKDLIASGRTDANGNFDINFADLNYTGGNNYKQIKVVVTQGDLEETKILPADSLKNPDLDLGEIICLANTYRYTPTIEMPEINAGDNKNLKVKIYREESASMAYPYLAFDGNIAPEAKQKITINGKKMVLVATDSVNVKTAGLIKFSRLFYDAQYMVEISANGQIDKKTGSLKVANYDLSPDKVLNVKPTYTLTASPPSIIGSVQLSLDNGFASVKNAIVRVEFKKEDILVGATNQTGLSAVLGNQQPYSAQLNTQFAAYNNMVVQAQSPSTNSANTAMSSNSSSFYSSNVLNSALGGGVKASATFIGNALTNFEEQTQLAPYSARTDSAGNYVISNLPKLKEGATFTVRLIKVPNQFKYLKVDPADTIVVARLVDGEQKDVSFRIKPELVQIVGRVVDADKKPLNNARLYFKGSTNIILTGQTGLFTATYFPGDHQLVIEKEGYVGKTIAVNIPAEITKKPTIDRGNLAVTELPNNVLTGNHIVDTKNIFGDNRNTQNTVANTIDLTAQLVNTPTVQQSIASNGGNFSPALFGVAGAQSNTAVSASGIGGLKLDGVKMQAKSSPAGGTTFDFSGAKTSGNNMVKQTSFDISDAMADVFNSPLTSSNYGSNSKKTIDLGDIGFLERKVGKIRFKVVDEANTAIANASIALFDTIGITDSKGEWFYKGFGGNATVRVTPQAGTAFIITEQSVLVNEDGVENVKTIKLQKGTAISGFVRSGNAAVNGAIVKVEDRPYLQATTDASGAYTLYVPKGALQVKASKSGYIAQSKSVTIGTTPQQLNFELGSGGERNIAKILGFDVELDKMDAEGASYRVSGTFVNLNPSLSDLKSSSKTQLRFSNIKISFDAQNNAIPEGNKIVTDELSIPFKLLNYLPVTLKAANGIAVESDGNNGGKITGQLALNMGAIQGSRGWTLQTADVFLVPDNSASQQVVVFTSNNTAASSPKYKISSTAGNWQGDIYGFKLSVETSAAFIDNNGLHLKGKLNTPDLGPIKTASFTIEEFNIGADLSVKTVKLGQTNLPSIKIMDWSASIASLLFNEDGFKLGGNMVIKVPASGTSNVSFSNISLAKDMMFGGTFTIPTEGINIFNIVRLKKGNTPISFGQVPNQSGVYKLGGSGKIQFEKFLTSVINIPVFEVHTSGKFLVDAPVDFEASLAFAKIKVQAIQFNSVSSTPYIGVQGAISVDVPILKFTAADITFKAVSGGVNVSVGKIKASLDVPVLKTDIEVELKDNGFAGAGKLSIPGTPINAGIDFHYFKVQGGIDFGASFSAGVVIPIGFVTIERVGGGFAYNTATKDFMININGAVSIANLGSAIKLDPIGLTVSSGPVIEGYAHLIVGTALDVADASIKLDIPQSTFSITVDAQIEPIKGVASAKLQGDLIISLKDDDKYLFIGAAMDINLLGLIKSNGEFAMGIGVRNPSTRADRISYYFRNVDTRYVGDMFSGVYINTTAKMGIPKERPIGFDFKIASAKLWCYTESNAKLILNFAEGNYLFGLSGRFGGGFEFCVFSIACAGFGYDACYEFMGGRNDSDGWFINGKAAGSVYLKVGGCNPDCNDWTIKPFCAGFKLCAKGGAEVGFSQRRGLKLSAFVGGTPFCP